MQDLSKMFFKYNAEAFKGTLEELSAKINEINIKKQLVFVSNLIPCNGGIMCLIQTKETKGRN